MLLVKQMNCGWYVAVAGEFQLKQGEVSEAGSAWEKAVSVGSSSFGWPSPCSQIYFGSDIFTLHITVPSSICTGWVCQCDAFTFFPGLSLDSGTPAGFACYHQVFGKHWSSQAGCAQAQDPAGQAHSRICLWMHWDPPAESLGYVLLSSQIWSREWKSPSW